MCGLDLDPCTLWEEKPVTARAWHLCDGCGCLIEPGQPYLRHANLFEGEFSREAMCFACWFIREEFAEAHHQTFAPSALYDTLLDCGAGDPDSEWRTHLAVMMRRVRRGRRVRERAVVALAAANTFHPGGLVPLEGVRKP